MAVAPKNIEIMDTTLRDGEQTDGVSFTSQEKVMIAKSLLADVGVNRIEVASARVSKEEKKTLSAIMAWAKENNFSNQIEVLSFVDEKKSIDWLDGTGCYNINLLTKGSENHCVKQLGKTLKDHLKDIEKTIDYAKSRGFSCSVYLEDWSNGIIHSPKYVWDMLKAYQDFAFKRVYLPDTLGILSPDKVYQYISETVQKFPDVHFEFHGHNDYGLAVANTLAAVNAGAKGIHVTVNSLGERAGNTDLAATVASLKDHANADVSVKEGKLKEISTLVETFSGKRISSNSPITGQNVFTQTAGIHADGDKKGDLYKSLLSPKRFQRDQIYALGKLSGKSNIDMNLEKLGFKLSEQQKKDLLEKIVELGDNKKKITTEDLPFLITDLFEEYEEKIFSIEECVITTSISMKPVANIRVRYKGKEYEEIANGNGGYDAFMEALRKIFKKEGLTLPLLKDFEVHIPPGGKTDALVETIIIWDENIRTHAVASDQVLSALKATERMINLREHKKQKEVK
ncbi:MAG: alpha-isopropylmalate synthase regulatory domain-containing protein [Alphaproteobacteria bacterium]